MGNLEIIIAAVLFFGLTATAFLLTLIEFVNMDKTPDSYRNPRYKSAKKSTSKPAPKSSAKRPVQSTSKSPRSTSDKKPKKPSE